MTNNLRTLVLIVVSLSLALSSNGQDKAAAAWTRGVYHGLITGVSTTKDVVRKLGKPKLKTLPEGPNDSTLLKWHYEEREANGLCCDLLFKSGVLQEITLDLAGIEQAKATQMFGGAFARSNFGSRPTRIEGGSAPLCEDPHGETVLLIDPTRGLYLWVEPDGNVSSATFSLSRPGVGTCRKRTNAHLR